MDKGTQHKILVIVRVIDEQVAHVRLLEVIVSLMFGKICMLLTFSRSTSGALQGEYASVMTGCTVSGVFSLSVPCYGGQPRLECSE
jgi:hypothetical protein